jgi:lipopolysaccharide/colanic/teichoic acid biosynthesis glycosyltransferase
MRKDIDHQQTLRCMPGCDCGHCQLMTETWFTRALSLERKRTERSRKPFILVLMNIEGLGELNGNRGRLVHTVVTALASFVRETDTTGWYRDGSVLGTIFTELGDAGRLNTSIDSIVAKVAFALEKQLGPEKSRQIVVSCHVFPEDWSKKRPDGSIDAQLYPDLRPRQRSSWLQSTGKRAIDLVLSVLALFALSPVFLLIAIAVKFSSKGPILFRQKRVGQLGKQFTFLKFRSMQVSNESTIHEQYVKRLITGRMGVPKSGVFKIQNDPRITPVGRFLRKTSLDELPQFWNVVTGEMSLVGPRPPLPYEVAVYDIWHRRRLLEAKPGITGLWQVTGRSRTCFDEMVRLDLHYMQSSCLWLDLKILLQTPRAVVAGTGAY